jgi:hypothetical protein
MRGCLVNSEESTSGPRCVRRICQELTSFPVVQGKFFEGAVIYRTLTDSINPRAVFLALLKCLGVFPAPRCLESCSWKC